jgi:hypothetical protein
MEQRYIMKCLLKYQQQSLCTHYTLRLTVIRCTVSLLSSLDVLSKPYDVCENYAIRKDIN